MTYIKLNYYSHLLLNSKYSLLIKLAIIISIYALFDLDSSTDIAYCAKMNKKQWMEKAQDQQMEINRLNIEIERLKNELNNRFRMSSDTQMYYLTREETLDSLKQKIEAYSLSHAEGFLTTEEQERPTFVRHTGAQRGDFNLGPEFFTMSKYEDVTTVDLYPHKVEGFKVDEAIIDETGKKLFDLHKKFRWHTAHMHNPTTFNETNSWFFFMIIRGRYKEVYYPANHPDNNFDPQFKRLRKLVEREFYEKQLPDKISDNCNIS